MSRFEVGVPVDLLPQGRRAGAKQIEDVIADAVGFGDDQTGSLRRGSIERLHRYCFALRLDEKSTAFPPLQGPAQVCAQHQRPREIGIKAD